MRRIRSRHLTLPLLLVALAATAPGRSAEPARPDGEESGTISEKVKKAGHELVQDAKAAGRELKDSKLGRQVEGAAREIAHDAAGAGKKGWDKTKSVSASAAEDVKRATHEFWNGVIRTKEAAIERLREENADLRKKGDEAPSRSGPEKEER